MNEIVLSFGAGVQTTALAILIAEGKVAADRVVFADTGAEKPETYWFMEQYTKPLLAKHGLQIETVVSRHGRLEDYCMKYRMIPSTIETKRWCSWKFKIDPINAHLKGVERETIIGFSADEVGRATRRSDALFPLIEQGMKVADCQDVIKAQGWPIPLKSSCFFCVFQGPIEWNWLKIHHPDLVARALVMEANYYDRRPETRHRVGLIWGKPLWKWVEGYQMELEMPQEYSCWAGYCGR